MPRHKEPGSLYDLAYKRFVSLIKDCCIGVGHQHGPYGTEKCVQAVQNLQNVLLSFCPVLNWNDLCERVLLSVHEHDLRSVMAKVLKICYALFAHEKLTNVVLLNSVTHYWGSKDLLYDHEKSLQFWDLFFATINKVQKIVFPAYIKCGAFKPRFAGLFRSISHHCRDLEEIYFSRDRDLTAEAVTFLLNCGKLRKIKFSESPESIGCRIPGIYYYKRLLESLPELEYFNDSEVVKCFPVLDGGHSLKLTNLIVNEEESTPEHITLAVQICKNLKHLKVTTFDVGCSPILGVLADSPINLTWLTLKYDTSFDIVSKRFFSTKGVHLLNLKFVFDCGSRMSFKLLKLIGKSCLNLKSLHVDISSSYSDDVALPTESDMFVDRQSPVFKKLTTLELLDESGDWVRTYFKWCVLHATNLETLTLHNLEQPTSEQPVVNLKDFHEMFILERFPELVEATFEVIFMDKEMIQCVFDNCPKLRKLTVACFDEADGSIEEYVEALKQFIASNNIDLTISYTPS